jgi:membrane carboxypeptidase/penicillin-binding protein
MGPAGTGSDSALPIWVEIMNAWIGNRTEPPQFEAPGNIVFVSVDRGSGAPAAEGTTGAITESFIAGTQPGSGFRQ